MDRIPLYKNSIKQYSGSNSKRVSAEPAQGRSEDENAKLKETTQLRRAISATLEDATK